MPRRVHVVGLVAVTIVGVLIGSTSAAQPAPMWAIAPSPNQSGAVENYLFDVSCGSAASCVAIGQSETSTSTQSPLDELWNGHVWSIMPRIAGAFSVSCPAATSCYGAGRAGSGPKIAHWNGKAWSTAKVPNPAVKSGSALLDDISCASTTSCVAVGYAFDAPNYYFPNRTFALVWRGRTWSLVKTPNPIGTATIDLSSLACASTTSCVAVGNYSTITQTPPDRSFAARWNGKTWSLTARPRYRQEQQRHRSRASTARHPPVAWPSVNGYRSSATRSADSSNVGTA
jgi:hypothetical protein